MSDLLARLQAEAARRDDFAGFTLVRVELPPALAEELAADGLPLPARLTYGGGRSCGLEADAAGRGGCRWIYRCRAHGATNCPACLNPEKRA